MKNNSGESVNNSRQNPNKIGLQFVSDPIVIRHTVNSVKKQIIGEKLLKIFSAIRDREGKMDLGNYVSQFSWNVDPHLLTFRFENFDFCIEISRESYIHSKSAVKVDIADKKNNPFAVFDQTKHFTSNTVGKRLKDILVKSSHSYVCTDHLEYYANTNLPYEDLCATDKIEELVLVFENNFTIHALSSVGERVPLNETFKSVDARIFVGCLPVDAPTDQINFFPGNVKEDRTLSDVISISDDNCVYSFFYLLMEAIYPAFDPYGDFIIRKGDILRIKCFFDDLYYNAKSFNEFLSVYINAYETSMKKSMDLNGERFIDLKKCWRHREIDRSFYDTFSKWLSFAIKKENFITVVGF